MMCTRMKGYDYDVNDNRYDSEYSEYYDQLEAYDKKWKAYNYDNRDKTDWGDEDMWKGWI